MIQGKSFIFSEPFDALSIYNLKAPGQFDIATNLEAFAENFDDTTVFSDSPFTQIYLNTGFIASYTFTSTHSFDLGVNYYYVSPTNANDISDNYHVFTTNIAYTYGKNISNIYITISPHLHLTAYQSKDMTFQNSYSPDLNHHNAGLSFGIMGRFPVFYNKSSAQFLWNTGITYDISLPKDELWRPGTIKVIGDIIGLFGMNSILLSLGVTQTIIFPQIIDNKWSDSDMSVSTLIRLGGTLLLGQNMYLRVMNQLAVYPFASILNTKMVFGYSFQTRSR